MKRSLQHTTNLISLRNITRGRLLLFFIWPFSGLIYAINNFRKDAAPAFFWLFCMYFGFVFIFADPVWGGKDSASYARGLIEMHHNAFSFEYVMSRLYNPLAGKVDIFEPIITWLVAIFTDDPRFLFLAVAAVFGFFYTQNLWMIFRLIKKRPGFLLVFLMLAYALTIPIWEINGVRMWTAAHIFIFGVLKYFLYDDKKGLIWTFLAVFVHFSFFFPLALLFIWMFLPFRYSIMYAFYIFSFFLKEIDLAAIRSALGFVPFVFQNRMQGYTSEAYAQVIQNAEGALAWHVQFAELAGKIVIIGWLSIIYLFRKKIENLLPHFKRFFLFTLFFGSIANIASYVPSGGRFVIIANMMFLALIILVLSKPLIHNRFRILKTLVLPFLLFLVIFRLRVGLDYIGFLTFFGNPLLAYFIEVQTPFIIFVKDLFS